MKVSFLRNQNRFHVWSDNYGVNWQLGSVSMTIAVRVTGLISSVLLVASAIDDVVESATAFLTVVLAAVVGVDAVTVSAFVVHFVLMADATVLLAVSVEVAVLVAAVLTVAMICDRFAHVVAAVALFLSVDRAF